MSAAFFDYVRGRSDEVPAGYSLQGMRVYRHLVLLGARQMVESCFPLLREQMCEQIGKESGEENGKEMGEQVWNELLTDFVRQSAWTSNFYGDLENEFQEYLARLQQDQQRP